MAVVNWSPRNIKVEGGAGGSKGSMVFVMFDVCAGEVLSVICVHEVNV